MKETYLKTYFCDMNADSRVNAVTRRDHILLGVMSVVSLVITYVLAALL